MRRKLIIIFVGLLFLTGCSLKQDLTISSNGISENVDIIVPKTDENKKKIYEQYESDLYAINNDDMQDKYNKKISESDNFYKLNYKYNFRFSDFKDNYIFNNCFDSFGAVYGEDDTFVISTSKGYKCMYFEMGEFKNYSLNIKSDFEVLESNADVIEKNNLIWNFNQENYKDKNIYLKLKLGKADGNKFSLIQILLIIFGVIFVIGGIIFLFAKAVGKKNNKI